MLEERKIKKIYKLARKITKLIDEAGILNTQEAPVVNIGENLPVVEELPAAEPVESSASATTPIEVVPPAQQEQQQQTQQSTTTALVPVNQQTAQQQEIQRLQEELARARQAQTLSNFNFKNI